jgi:hypothetical protein
MLPQQLAEYPVAHGDEAIEVTPLHLCEPLHGLGPDRIK